ncbi:TRADD-N-associated membrane domain-containing protein [Streptomyces hyaluromycini]|uniref:TRADD-N-associated membrane domain-containing protein n=1 Tax=Streptomyces hyaluromycini TaxID=1377993 RepID=UPI001237CB3B|nr:hypothetical protein [Streptomyces hyaluromycini]
MADNGGDRPDEQEPTSALADANTARRNAAELWLADLAETTRFVELREALGVATGASGSEDPQAGQRVVQTAGEVHNVFIGPGMGTVQANRTENIKPSLAEQRQKFHFDFLKHAMKQSEWTFRLSVYFMTGGAVVILVGAVLALIHAGSASSGYVPLVTSLSGVLITTGGGALALHSKRAMTNLTKAAEANEAKIDADHQLETATTLIDRVQDQNVKDRLNSAAALKALNIQPDPDTMLQRLLPGDPAKEINLGDSNR